MHDTSRRSPAGRPEPRRGLAALFLDPRTRASVLVGLTTWTLVSGALAVLLLRLGYAEPGVDLPRAFILAVGFAAGAAALLAHGCGRSFLGSAEVLPTLAGLGVYALPVLAASTLPYAVLGPARFDFAGAMQTALAVAPPLLLVFAVLATAVVRRALAAGAEAAAAYWRHLVAELHPHNP